MKLARASTIFLLLLAPALTACDNTSPTEPGSSRSEEAAADIVKPGRLVSSRVWFAPGPLRTGWVFAGGPDRMAFGYDAQISVLDLSVPSATPTPLPVEVNAFQFVEWAEGAGRLFFGDIDGARSVSLDDPSDVEEHLPGSAEIAHVSPNGRWILYSHYPSPDSDLRLSLLDRDTDETRAMPSTLSEASFLNTRVFDGYVLTVARYGEHPWDVAVWDLETDEVTPMTGLGDGYVVIGLGGPREQPHVTLLRGTDGLQVVRFTGDPVGGEGTEEVLASLDGTEYWAHWRDNVTGGVTPDGSRVAVSITRDLLSGCWSTDCVFAWDILVIDVATGDSFIAASGASSSEPQGLVLSRDGQRLLYETDSELYLLELDRG